MNMEKTMAVLYQQLAEMQDLVKHKEIINPQISKASVGWHLSHNLKVFNNVLDALQNSSPADYKISFNLKKTLVFLTGRIPRGKAKSPKVVLPPEIITEKDLYEQIKRGEAKLQNFDRLDKNVNFRHPYFNRLNKKETKKFLKIHTEHHLKIIRDILKAEK